VTRVSERARAGNVRRIKRGSKGRRREIVRKRKREKERVGVMKTRWGIRDDETGRKGKGWIGWVGRSAGKRVEG